MKQQNSTFVFRVWRLLTLCKHAGGNESNEPSASSGASPTPSSPHLFVFFLLLLLGAFVSFRWINTSKISSSVGRTAASHDANPYPPLTCHAGGNGGRSLSCPSPPPPPPLSRPIPLTPWDQRRPSPPQACPAYFRWIHEDLRPWAPTGITREMVERAKEKASFRLVVLGGRAYVEKYGRRTFQTRDLFTQWGILQLLRRHPGLVPDLELMFDCVDHPAVSKAAYPGWDREKAMAPPVFGYCRDDSTLDIVFPDWSFWGWPEINIKPWEPLLEDIKEGNRRMKWVDREPYAFWKGNPSVSAGRKDLLRCNVSGAHDWNARLYAQDWNSEIKKRFKTSDLASQCRHRYKIYIEGSTWSVSEKYILACDSPTLLVKPRYYDFFSRGLVPLRHYWPVRDTHKCPSIKFAVDWGNNNKEKAQEIGKEGSGFIQEELKMDHVYDYMFHLLNEYAKLCRFKPTKPREAVEVCPETLACHAKGLEKEFMVQSMVKAPRDAGPCTLPPPFSPAEMRLLLAERANSTEQVEVWEKAAWEGQKTKV